VSVVGCALVWGNWPGSADATVVVVARALGFDLRGCAAEVVVGVVALGRADWAFDPLDVAATGCTAASTPSRQTR
jgi:hypothetical protein